MSGCVVILNGAPRSGRSSIARALQQSGAFINFGVDAAIAMTPEALRPGIGLRPDGERPELEPFVQQLNNALLGAIAEMAREGLDVVSNLGLHASYSRPLDILADAAQRLAGLEMLLVAVRCPIETLMARRMPDDCAAKIQWVLAFPPSPSAYERLASL